MLLLLNNFAYLEFETLTNELALNNETYISSTYRTLVKTRINSLLKILSNRYLKKKSIQVDRESSISYRSLQKI